MWAYGTSPHGLGLREPAFWLLSPREYYALREVEQARVRRWAEAMALRINLKLKEGAEPFTAEDFMGIGNREQRERERAMAQRRVAELNRKVLAMKPGDKPAGLPKWAIG